MRVTLAWQVSALVACGMFGFFVGWVMGHHQGLNEYDQDFFE